MGASKVEGWYKASIRVSSKAELSSYFPLALCPLFDACQSSLTLLKVELALLLLSGWLMPVNMQQSSTEAIYVRVAQCCTPFPVRVQALLREKKWRKQKVKTEYPPADVLKGMLSIAEFGVAGEPFLWWWS